MRTLLLAPELFAAEGGIMRILRLYLKGLCDLARPGDVVRLVVLNDRVLDSAGLRRYSNPHLVECQVASRHKVRFCRAVLRAARASDRIVCGHVAQLPVAWLATWLRPRLKVYLVAHGLEVWRPFSLLERLALRRADGILCVSDFTRRQILAARLLPAERLFVLPNALDPYLAPAAVPSEPSGAPVILAVTRLTIADDYKGIGHLIAALPAILAAVPGATLRIVGRGNGQPALEAQARRLQVRERVEFTGYRSDAELETDLIGCSLFALPSEKEGFGLVYLEAMAHGRPCLGARAGGVPEVITPESGVLVEYGDVPGIAAAAVAALGRTWDRAAIVARANEFSYLRFRERLGSLLSE